jgi:hypothetical protein
MAVTVPVRVAWVVLLAVCGAFCQEPSLPDAPSALVTAQQESLRASPVDVALPLAGTSNNARVIRESGLGKMGRPAQPGFTVSYRTVPVQKSSRDLFTKYLYPSLLKRNLDYHPSTSDSLMGRALYAASRIFVTRDDSGRGRVNTSYFVGVLSAAVLHTAYRPYWARSAGAPFSDFGSTIGNDAGMNLFHEFRPGLQQLMKNHAPKLVSRIEERVGRN